MSDTPAAPADTIRYALTETFAEREDWDEAVHFALEALASLLAERDEARAALLECATLSGADVSGGAPTEPPIHEWAIQEVRQLRADYDEASVVLLAAERLCATRKEALERGENDWTFIANLHDDVELVPEVRHALAVANLALIRAALRLGEPDPEGQAR